jgi:hypothetical protein
MDTRPVRSLSHIEVASTQPNAIAKAGAVVLHSGTPPMLLCAGAGSWYSGGFGSVLTRKGSSLELLAQETSAMTTIESAETRIIDFFMAGTLVAAAGQCNRRTPSAVKQCELKTICRVQSSHDADDPVMLTIFRPFHAAETTPHSRRANDKNVIVYCLTYLLCAWHSR